MAYDQALAARVRRVFATRTDVDEKSMFGGLAFMVRGHLCCGIVRERLMVRVGPDRYDALLRKADAAPMDFTGRPLRGLLYVKPAGLAGAKLRQWIMRAVDFVESEPVAARRRRGRATRVGTR